MLIVLSQDPRVIEWCQSRESHADAWGELVIINAASSPVATVQLRHALRRVRPDEPLCLTGHGNDTVIGDVGDDGVIIWWWTVEDIAAMFAAELSGNYAGPILIRACAKTVTNFSTRTAVRLGELRALTGVWIYGYSRAVSIWAPFIQPRGLDHNVEVHGTRVP
jgi:hypothetical protein